jgi:hypothetical protein
MKLAVDTAKNTTTHIDDGKAKSHTPMYFQDGFKLLSSILLKPDMETIEELVEHFQTYADEVNK